MLFIVQRITLSGFISSYVSLYPLSEKKFPPNFTIPTDKIANTEDKFINQSENTKTNEENYKEEIPAFLRRQAN